MLTRERIIGILKKERSFLKTEFGVKRIAVFGSFVKGSARKKSDIDVVVEFDRSPGMGFFRLSGYLEKRLGRKLDILTPAGVKTIRSQRIAREIRESLRYV